MKPNLAGYFDISNELTLWQLKSGFQIEKIPKMLSVHEPNGM